MSWPEVKIEAFEGPFDLLLELAAAHKVDLAEVSLAALTHDFLRYLKEHDVSMQEQGAWLVVAAQLLVLKARLANSEAPEEDGEDDGLQERVRLYQLYRKQAEYLRARWGNEMLGSRGERQQSVLAPVTVRSEELSAAFERVLRRIPQPVQPKAHLVAHGRSLEECLAVMRKVLKRKPEFVFQEELRNIGRSEAAVSFLALLELHRSRQAELVQGGNFEQLVVRRV